MSKIYEQVGILDVIKDKIYEANEETSNIKKMVKEGKGLATTKLVGIVNEIVAKLGELK